MKTSSPKVHCLPDHAYAIETSQSRVTIEPPQVPHVQQVLLFLVALHFFLSLLVSFSFFKCTAFRRGGINFDLG